MLSSGNPFIIYIRTIFKSIASAKKSITYLDVSGNNKAINFSEKKVDGCISA
jgi:hypothetical protein